MKILVFGANGLLGAAVTHHLARRFEVRGTSLAPGDRDLISGIDLASVTDIERAFEETRPNAVVNCAGIVKSECDQHDVEYVTAVNGRAPHVMAATAQRYGARFIHVSTDCVFDGKRGDYREVDTANAQDVYGRTKAAGEVDNRGGCVTMRTSFIGLDLRRGRGLLDWLLAQKGEVQGYTRARWSGLSTYEVARAVELILRTPSLYGLYHVVGPTITKADLLTMLVRIFKLECRVVLADEPILDRTLNGERFREATGYVSPAWEEMAEEIAQHARDHVSDLHSP